MTKVVSVILTIIMTIGIIFYVFNAEIGPGLKEGGDRLQQKILEATQG